MSIYGLKSLSEDSQNSILFFFFKDILPRTITSLWTLKKLTYESITVTIITIWRYERIEVYNLTILTIP